MTTAGVIGWPVAHSRSPLIHRFWLQALGIDGDYARFAVRPDRLGAAIGALPALGLAGVNVTVPHKVAVMAHLDAKDAIAGRVGAVNCVVVRDDGSLWGTNTDVAGFLEPLDDAVGAGQSASDDHYVVIGTGGAARAVLVALAGRRVTLIGRDVGKAQALVAELGDGSARWSVAPLAGLRDGGIGGAGGSRSVIINASVLGMRGQPPLAIGLDGYRADTIVYDLVYAPLETPLLAVARRRGLQVIDGLGMLIGQAAVAFALFYGAAPPRERDSALRSLLVDGTQP